MTATFLVGDVRARMADLEDGSFDLILCSPPFLALRSYLPDGHPDKHLEIGSEATPAEFLDTMLELTAEWGRLLAPHGSIAIELGDTYAGSGGAGGDYTAGGLRDGQPRFRQRNDGGQYGSMRPNSDKHNLDVRSVRGGGAGWPLPKSLVGIPQLYQLSITYGRNILRSPLSARELVDMCEQWVADNPDMTVYELIATMGYWIDQWEERSPTIEYGRWRVRNLKAWIRSNPPVGALGDKERPATSYIIVACRATDRWFDLDAVRTQAQPGSYGTEGQPGHNRSGTGFRGVTEGPTGYPRTDSHAGGAPPRDWTHTVDLILDTELAARAGKPNNLNPNGAGGHQSKGQDNWHDRTGTSTSGSIGAQGVHLRRALEHAGILTPQDFYDISPKGYRGAHYAVWPPELARRLIDEMCPRHVCSTCGEPRRRLGQQAAFARQPELAAHIKERREALGLTSTDVNGWFGYKEIAKNWERTDQFGAAVPNARDWPMLKERLGLSDDFDDFVMSRDRSIVEYEHNGETLGAGERRGAYGRGGHTNSGHRPEAQRRVMTEWSDCGHNTWRPGRVLDPFVGSGTTLAVATGMARDSVGIDLDARNATLAYQRVGMFLDVDGDMAQPDLTPASPDALEPVADVIESL